MRRNADIPSLTGLRAIAALWVVIFHVGVYIYPPWKGAGYLGVDIFFVLSGFVLAHNYADMRWASYGSFLWKRLARIYPVHLVTLVMIGAISLAFTSSGIKFFPSLFSMEGLVSSVLLFHGWSTSIDKTWNLFSWSISCEWAAYLAFPAIAWASLRITKTWIPVALVGLLFVLLAWWTFTINPSRTMEFGLFRIAAEFPAGVLLHRLWTLRGQVQTLAGDFLAVISFAVLALGGAALEAQLDYGAAMRPLPVLCALCVFGVALSAGPLNRFLSSPLMQYLGRASYSLYMVHGIVMLIAKALLRDLHLNRGLIILLALTMSFVLAHLLYRYIEEPCRKYLTRSSSRSKSALATATMS